MKILFLEIDTEQSWALASAGPASIAAYIRQHGHDASLLRVRPDSGVQDIRRGIERAAPDILGFSLTARQYLRAVSIAGELRKGMNLPIIAGGLQATFSPLAVMASGVFDYVCLGEGEEAVCNVLSHLQRRDGRPATGIPNIWANGSSQQEIRPPAAIDDLPFMARDLLDETHGIVHISTMRGCPFSCTYCAGGAVGRLYGDGKNYVRRRSVGRVMEELRQIREHMAVNYVIFLDDTFTVNGNWVKAFCGAYEREMDTGFSINARAETVSREMITMLARAGCKHIVYGVESGSKRVREEILNRPGENGQVIDAFKWTREAGIMATANYMIGVPGETKADIEQTLALNDELAPDDFGCFVFYPYPGTPLFEVCRREGYLPEHYLDLPAGNRRSVLTLPDLTEADIGYYYEVFTRVRENNYLKKYGGSLSETDKAAAIKNLRDGEDAG